MNTVISTELGNVFFGTTYLGEYALWPSPQFINNVGMYSSNDALIDACNEFNMDETPFLSNDVDEYSCEEAALADFIQTFEATYGVNVFES